MCASVLEVVRVGEDLLWSIPCTAPAGVRQQQVKLPKAASKPQVGKCTHAALSMHCVCRMGRESGDPAQQEALGRISLWEGRENLDTHGSCHLSLETGFPKFDPLHTCIPAPHQPHTSCWHDPCAPEPQYRGERGCCCYRGCWCYQGC